MKNWIKERLDYLDFKSFFGTVVILSIAIGGLYYLTDIRDRFRQTDLENFTGNTTGQIISIEPIVRNRQTKWRGTEIYTDSYKIRYTYNINGQSFDKTDFIQLNSKNKNFLEMVLERDPTDTFEIHYDLDDPEKSILATVD
jgi:hypothetical protein